MELLLNKCDTTIEEDGTLSEDCATNLVEHRGVRAHSAGGLDGQYGSYILAHWIPNEDYYIPTLDQLEDAVWPALADDIPFAIDPPE